MTQRSDDGFFTFEALVALAITSFVLVAYFQATSYALRGAAKSRTQETVLAKGLSMLEAASDSLGQSSNDPLTGKIEDISWSLRLEPIAFEQNAATASVEPRWVIFDAIDGQGREVLELRTIKIVRRQK